MVETKINLSIIQFADTSEPLFTGKELILSSKNFIFAKNGSGKSTLSDAIVNQKSSDFDVQVFKGFEQLIGENENLDAFSLAVDAGEKEEEIRKLNKKLEEKRSNYTQSNQKITKPENGEENFFSKLEASTNAYKEQEHKLDKFYTDSARSIGKKSNPQLVTSSRNYNRNHFKAKINQASLLQDVEINQLKQVLKSESKNISTINVKVIDFNKYLSAVNDIISSKVEERVKIKRLDNQEKINFAKTGLHIHEKGQVCAFCGHEITDDTFNELESYFSADEVKALQNRIKKGKEQIKNVQDKLDDLELTAEVFYPNLIDNATDEIEKIKIAKGGQIDFLQRLYEELENKEKNLFIENQQLDITVPAEIDFSKINQLIVQNNQFASNLKKEQENARDKLRFHEIQVLLNDGQYETEKAKLTNLENNLSEKQKDFDEESKRLDDLQKEIDQLNFEIEKLKPKAEKQAIERINKKLRSKVQWELDFYEDENSGYYRVKQGDKYRSVKKLSTGEKNIIAFLYFIEKLEEVKENQVKKTKLIVFDDPMSSNDDTMQYLIVWELQRLYQGKDRPKYDGNKDILVILTHNVHFYLNVQPHGNFKDNKGRTKYDKNNFYRIDNHKFVKIKSEKEDFKTSYEALWVELKDLYNCGHKNSMLNSMRRIIETYMKFNSLKQEDFYHDNEQYLKLFNVNSHSIDDLSAETFTESIDEMRNLFKQIFEENGYVAHFDSYWKF
ncbi:AAA family ATPase [Streptococcus sobrinus]|uniref:AAA family ATPase n=1 Tax=Streptococcus sobrinus TaxID=1310 RepID=UPI0002ED0E5E|nr:AAA family ATPase [Streptococcus sobrinus]